MDADTILRLKPALTEYLHLFDGCFGRVNVREYLDIYVGGQLSDLPRKSIEPMADAAGVPPRNLQEFLADFDWDEAAARERYQTRIARRHAHSHSVGILDETGIVKKGMMTAGVQRQYCGRVGKTENCVVTVHLGYATPDFHTLLDGELYLPAGWAADRARCREAGIPDEVVYRPKWQIGIEEITRARGNGIHFAYMIFDEGYGGKPPFLRALEAMGQRYVGEVPRSVGVWTTPPAVVRDAPRPRRGRPRKGPDLAADSPKPVAVEHLLSVAPPFGQPHWRPYRVKDGQKGPMVWEVKRFPVWMPDADGLPRGPYQLVLARNVLDPEEVKYFISNAPVETTVETLLVVAFSRWKVERMFEDGKSELGLSHFEVRKYPAIRRHLLLTCISYLFLAEFHEAHREKKSRPDGGPGADGHVASGGHLVAWGPVFAVVGRDGQPTHPAHPATQPQGGTLPPQAPVARIARPRPVSEGSTHVSRGSHVAL